ncbi:phosphate acyltransferase PlsX [bacterium]|nr:phosphate acyltransferase PlsX [bacterium]
MPDLNGHEVILVGDEGRIEEEARKLGGLPSCVTIQHASQAVTMTDSPVEAIRRKPDSSIARCVALVSDGKADAIVSAGNTGAVVALSTLKLGLLENVRRPGIAVGLPTRHGGHTMVIDCGANVKCTPEHLYHYGVMATHYERYVYGCENPRVALLNIGAESVKGNPLVKQAHELFEGSDLNYVGYVEGGDIYKGDIDVVVCEGFVGNVVLKVSEGLAMALMGMVKDAFTRTLRRRVGGRLCKFALLEIKDRVDSSEFGAAPLLGVNGTVMIAHGHSDGRAIANAVRNAIEATSHHMNEHIVADLRAGDAN